MFSIVAPFASGSVSEGYRTLFTTIRYVAVGLRENRLAQRVAFGSLVDEALPALVHEDAVAARRADVFHEARSRGAAGVQLYVGQSDEFRSGGFCQLETLSLGAGLYVRAADGVVQLHVGPDAVC